MGKKRSTPQTYKVFVLFKLQPWEKVRGYSLVDHVTLSTIPEAIIEKVEKVEDKLYTKEELEALRDKLVATL